MPSFPSLHLVGLVLLALLNRVFAEEPLREPARQSAPIAGISFSHIGAMAQAASDLRNAADTCVRLASALAGPAETIANSLATMSSEFDPFGYKTAFRTIRHQSEMLQQQREIIHRLQEREIQRLRMENERLKKEAKSMRKNKRERSRN